MPATVERDDISDGTLNDHVQLRVAWFGHAEGRRADGLSTYSRETVAALASRGVDVRFFAHAADGEVSPSDEPIRLRSLRFKTLTVSMPGSTERIAAELDAFAPDVVHCSWSFSHLDGAIGRMGKARGAATVATFHLPYAEPRSARGRVLRGLYRYHARALSEYDRCVALSDDQRDLLRTVGYPDDRIEVIHNGVDTEVITPGPSELRERLGARFVVAYMGRLDPEKRVPALVRSFLDMEWPDDHVLLIAGGGTQESRIRRLAGSRTNVQVMGVVTDPDLRLDLLRAADVFVLPSTAEGLALSMLEAMSAGCAVVATDAGEDGPALGDAGIRLPVEPLEPHLGDALRRLRADPALRRELGLRARQRVVTAYGLQGSVERLVNLYDRLRSGRAVAA
ncbi:MAG TPA: glycosyltransferase family 4 protein [Candidatus Dormibacteraeota bacterium]|nr:glycosyltransferase family 4 protein [Candidatus Dormibacteraeota bacterium]